MAGKKPPFVITLYNYVLMTFTRGAAEMVFELKSLDGKVLYTARHAGR